MTELNVITNKLRKAELNAPRISATGKSRIQGFRYNIELEDEDKTQLTIESIEIYEVGERIIYKKLGVFAKILSKKELWEKIEEE